MVGDGQVSLGNTVVKPNARKIRRVGDDIVVGFAGATADALTLLERLERKLDEYPGALRARLPCPATHPSAALRPRREGPDPPVLRPRLGCAGQLLRASVELAKAWRTEKYLRRLEVRPRDRARPSRFPHPRRSPTASPAPQATMIVSDKSVSLQITGNGDVLEPADDVIGAVGTRGPPPSRAV